MIKIYNSIRTVFYTSLITCLFVGFQNCGKPYDISSTQSASNGSSGGTTGSPIKSPPSNNTGDTSTVCTPQTAKGNLRIMFLVDESGSTFATDPNTNLRTKTAEYFISANTTNTNLTYSYSFFSDYGGIYDFKTSDFITVPFYKPFPESPSARDPISSSPFGNAQQALTVTKKFNQDFTQGKLRAGETNYELAFQVVEAIIQKDRLASSDYSYAIVFMSDGYPTQGGGQLKQYIERVRHRAGGHSKATVSSVYFGDSTSSAAISIMKDVAAWGEGEFVDSNSTQLSLQNIIQNVIQVPSGACQENN